MKKWYIIASLVATTLWSCTANKFLPENEVYYDGASIQWKSSDKVKDRDKNKTISDMETVPKPEPNTVVLGMRPKVWFYNIAGDVKKEKGFRFWLKYKLGEEPVYLSAVDLDRNKTLLENRLQVNGFFQGIVIPEVKEGAHSAHVKYVAHVSAPYLYDSIYDYAGNSPLEDSIRVINQTTRSLVRKNRRYDLSVLQQERVRLKEELKDRGFFYFDDHYIKFRSDSTVGKSNRRIGVHPAIKESMPEKNGYTFRIRKVRVFSDYLKELQDSTLNGEDLDTVNVEGIDYIYRRDFFRPEIITSHVRVRPGDYYNHSLELTTLNRLIQLDVFRLVNLEFNEVDSNLLDASVYLNPYKKKSLRAELNAVTTSESFAGPHLKMTFRNRNFLRGAENYELSLTAGYEWQIGGKKSTSDTRTNDQNINLLNSFEVGVNQTLTVPRLITPFNLNYDESRYIPETEFSLGVNFLRRPGFYQFSSFQGRYGFHWRQTTTRRQAFYPIDVTYVRLSNTTTEFDEILSDNDLLRRSLENQFILGSSYSFWYSSQEDLQRSRKTDNFYFNANFDVAGNLMYLISDLRGNTPTDETGSYTVFNQAFSQFVRADFDIRHYHRISKEYGQLVTRLLIGTGISYGNSETMPYSKQFSVGGSNSLRGFRARSIGPGTYEGDPNVNFVDQTGDIRLEMNIEWRFTLFGPLKGALFYDVGNIWTLRDDPDRAGTRFDFNTFYKQLAMDTGLGVRYDLDIFVIRLDLGLPLVVPYADSVDRNPVLNIAIGYPF